MKVTKEAKELDLPLLTNPFENKVDIYQLSLNRFPEDKSERFKNTDFEALRIGFVEGYKAAQSKQFSLEDMREAFNVGERNGVYLQGGSYDKSDECDFEEFMHSLYNEQLPKEFIPIMKCGRCYKPDDNEEECWSAKECSRHNGDYEDLLKTTTNSEGKQVLVGNYKY